MALNNEEQGLAPRSQKDIANPKEKTTEEIQKEIVDEVARLLQDPEAVTLQYPGEPPFYIANSGAEPDYEHGSQERFVMVKVPSLVGRDEICVALVNNPSRRNTMTRGNPLFQGLQGKHSEREIAVTRFAQSPTERIRKRGRYALITSSDTVPYKSATVSLKGQAFPNSQRVWKNVVRSADWTPPPPFIDTWNSGFAQLASSPFYSISGPTEEFESSDYVDLLSALRKSRVDRDLTQKVVAAQVKVQFAKVTGEPLLPNSSNSPQISSPDAK